MSGAAFRPIFHVTRRGGFVYHSMDGWNWIWMSFAGAFWLLMIGGVVYIAVRLAQQHDRRP
jgi:hypothetical protein